LGGDCHFVVRWKEMCGGGLRFSCRSGGSGEPDSSSRLLGVGGALARGEKLSLGTTAI
jgi:hypothetical protein